MVAIEINTPKMRSDEALAGIQQLLHYMERIGRLQHCIMHPIGEDPSQRKAGDKLWQPWTLEEREYIKGVRTVFAHARCSVLQNGSLRVKDGYNRRPGKPEIDGLHFDKSISEWEWTAYEFQRLTQRLNKLVLQRFRINCVTTVTCQTCGQSVDGLDYLACGHVEYPEGPRGVGISKPKGGTLQITSWFDCQGDMGDELVNTATKGAITYDGLDLILSDLETNDKIASELAKKGTPAYIVEPDSSCPGGSNDEVGPVI